MRSQSDRDEWFDVKCRFLLEGSCSADPSIVRMGPGGEASSVVTFNVPSSYRGQGRGTGEVFTLRSKKPGQRASITIITPDFSLSCAGQPTVSPGSSTSDNPCTLYSVGGFAGTVNLSCSGGPPGGYCSTYPTSVSLPPDGTAPFDVTAYLPPDAPPGEHSFTVTGTSNGRTHTTQFRVRVG
ncbi:MAG: hypothetical protein HYU28_05435 [Actinobacteria bacterium]|nr:hypothetical protein [Actinomycetota bacterium]